ncbi:MAG: methyltransferase domain-containing protein [Oscillospiraceae bacterium]|nr:methyltransferase domain-containing protein [Oscillospiraceae bacterium]
MGLGLSAYTSVNKDKVPQLFTLAVGKGLIRPGDFVFDIGCGRWPETVKEFLRENGVDVIDQWDPNWFPNADYVPIEGYDVVCLSNVLNVIGDRAERVRALKMAWDALKPGGLMLVTVYEADGSGASGPSKDGCWQERRKLNSYIDSELAPYMGAVAYGKLWLSMRKPAPGKKFWPPVGTKATICRIYGGTETPVTVIGRKGQFLLVRDCLLHFDGPRYYDTVADRISEGREGIEQTRELSWKKTGWHEKGKYGGYVDFGRWVHQPNLD